MPEKTPDCCPWGLGIFTGTDGTLNVPWYCQFYIHSRISVHRCQEFMLYMNKEHTGSSICIISLLVSCSDAKHLIFFACLFKYFFFAVFRMESELKSSVENDHHLLSTLDSQLRKLGQLMYKAHRGRRPRSTSKC